MNQTSRRSPALRRLLPPALLALALFPSCREARVQSYRIAKESDTPPPAMTQPGADMAATPVATASGHELIWDAPAHWTSKTASSMRKATYVITGADGATAELAITAFPGDVGGDLANVNRWLGQLGRPAITTAELTSYLQRSTSHGLPVALVDLPGPQQEKPQRMLGAIVLFEGSSWFFKLTGPDALVAAEKPAFLAFAQTIRADENHDHAAHAAPAAAPSTPAPAAPPATDMANTAVRTAGGPGLRWTAPADWQSKPASAMRKATFVLPAPGGATTELAVTAFPGDVGGELANVNRWRNQLGLAPLATPDLATAVTRRTHNNLNFAIVDFPAGSQRLLGAIVPFGNDTWFFKLTGPDAAIAAQKPAFLAFLETVQAP